MGGQRPSNGQCHHSTCFRGEVSKKKGLLISNLGVGGGKATTGSRLSALGFWISALGKARCRLGLAWVAGELAEGDGILPCCWTELRPAGETADPDDFVSAQDDRPGFLEPAGKMLLLQELLQLLGAFAVGGPETVSRSPVANDEGWIQQRGIE